jgi:hypothetical protein
MLHQLAIIAEVICATYCIYVICCEQRGSERIAVLEQLLEDKGDGRSAATTDTNATLLERHLHSNRQMTQVLLLSQLQLLSLLLILLSMLLLVVVREAVYRVAAVITTRGIASYCRMSTPCIVTQCSQHLLRS